MKTKVWMAAIAAILMSGYASAWTSTFFDRTHSGSFTEADADTPQDAQRVAFQECRKRAPDTDCVELGSPKQGTTVVLAKGTKKSKDDNIYIEWDPDPEKAAKQILQDCNEVARDCHLVLAVWDTGIRWAAFASNQEGSSFLNFNSDTKEKATEGAIRGCEERASTKGKCKVHSDMVTGSRAWFAFAENSTDRGIGFSVLSEQDAKQRAMDFCQKGSDGGPCKITETYQNKGLTLAPPAFAKLKARIEREESQRNSAAQKQVQKKIAAAPAPSDDGSCRPRGNTLRCSSQCTNGNCLVTYENGCKIRVQVQPTFNSLNNRWDYPAPSC